MPSFDSPPVKPAPARPAPGSPPNTSAFAGMDKDTYPGDRVMTSLIKNTNLEWTGFYLTPAPSQGHNLGWMSKHDFLRGLGWGIAPIYVGRQEKTIPRTDHRMTPENGKIDGAHAAQLAGLARIPVGSVIYLDFENGPPLSKEAKAYYMAWAAALQGRGFLPGVYCLFGIAAGLAAAVPDGEIWAVNYSRFRKQLFKSPYPQPDPRESGVPNALLWQLQGNVKIEYDDIQGGKKQLLVDLNSSEVPDPSGIVKRKPPGPPRLIPR
jgi:hypothetical protein